MDNIPIGDEQFERDEAGPRGDGVPWGGIVGTLGMVLLVIFAVQNTETVSIEFLWMSGEFPISIVILVTGVSAGVVALLSAAYFRRRRRTRRAEKDELRQLRDDS